METTTRTGRLPMASLSTEVTVGKVLDSVPQLIDALEDRIYACIEHWSDDEGLHWMPFQDDLGKELREVIESVILEELVS